MTAFGGASLGIIHRYISLFDGAESKKGDKILTHLSNLCVLVLGNDAKGFEGISRQLIDVSDIEYHLLYCANLHEAHTFMLPGAIDVILVDLSSVDSSSSNAVSYIRNLTSRLPIVALTNKGNDEVGEHAIQQGAQDFLPSGDVIGSTLSRVIKYAIKRKHMDEKLEKLSTLDPITDLFNRRYFYERGWNAYLNAVEKKQAMAMVIVRVDHFKKVNEFYGHVCGDKVLQKVAGVFKTLLRQMDLIARFGAEEFIILMPESAQKEVDIIAERLRLEVAATPVEYNEKSFHITVSIGVSVKTNREGDFGNMIQQASQSLTHVQEKGGNAVERFKKGPVDDYLCDS